jgi:hypothetical protein
MGVTLWSGAARFIGALAGAVALLALGGTASAQVNVNELLGGGGEAGVGSAAPGGDAAGSFQEIAKRYEKAVAVVVVVAPDGQGGYRPVPFGTAWAFAPTLLGTNAHVAGPVADFLQKGLQVYVIPNGSRGEAHRVARAVSHPRFGDPRPNAMGRKPFPLSYDIGVLEVETPFAQTVRLADPDALHRIESGTPVAFLGFPTENLIGGNVNLQNPIATMQTGIVTSISDFFLEDGGPERNRLIRHNLPATGGASGSPLFLQDGTVAGALNAGNINMVEFSTKDGVQQYRIPSAAQVNFGMRIDILQEMLAR